MKICILCQRVLPEDPRPWWKRWTSPPIPQHPGHPGSSRADLERCWQRLNGRLGVKEPEPMPDIRVYATPRGLFRGVGRG